MVAFKMLINKLQCHSPSLSLYIFWHLFTISSVIKALNLQKRNSRTPAHEKKEDLQFHESWTNSAGVWLKAPEKQLNVFYRKIVLSAMKMIYTNTLNQGPALPSVYFTQKESDIM